jgi:two-component system, cell cycle sensor histidine kinase and response regulator CckA
VDVTEPGSPRSALFAAILQETSDMVATADAAGRVLFLNRAARRALGLGDSEDVARLQLADLHVPWAAERLLEIGIPEAWRLGVWRGESALRGTGDGELSVSQVLSGHRDVRGEPEFLSLIAHDIENQKESAQALLEANRRLVEQSTLLAAIVRNAPAVAIQGYDEEARITFWNPASERLYGFREADAIGRRLGELIFSPSQAAEWEALVKQSIATGQPLPLQEWETHDEAGQTRWILSSSFPVQTAESAAAGATRLVCMDVDMTARIQAEQRLFASMEAQRALEEQLVHAQKLESVGRLAGGVAHDFNNLLTVIMGYVSLASEDKASDLDLRGALHQIHDAAERGATLVGQLLAFARRQIHQPRPVNLRELVARLEQMLSRLIGEDVRLETRPSELTVSADPGQLEQVLVNLVVNARDAMPRGGVLTIEMRTLYVEADAAKSFEIAPGQFAELVVSDTGSGMSEDVRQRVFEPFFTTKPFGEGTGLGLATCYGIVRQHQGAIWVDSELGQGTSFHILLPLAEAAPLETGTPQGPTRLERSATVLVVEDEPEVRNVTLRILKREGLRAIGAGSAEEARALMREHGREIDLVISDIVMPGMNGPELVQSLRAEVPDLRVLFVSGYTSHSALSNTGGDDPRTSLLPKPFTPDALVAALAKLLQS